MYSSWAILSAAAEIRTALPDLMPKEAPELRARLDELLKDGTDDAADDVLALLNVHTPTRRWLAARLELSGAWTPTGPDTPRGSFPKLSSYGYALAARPSAVYARIDALPEVVAGVEFEVVVGLAAARDALVSSVAMKLPPPGSTLAIHVTADNMRLSPGEAWRNERIIAADGSLPEVTLHLTAEPQADQVREARIQANYAVDGVTIGFGSRVVIVARSAADRTGAVPRQPKPGIIAPLPETRTPADLTVRISRGQAVGELVWTFETPHPLRVPDVAPRNRIGDELQVFTRGLIGDVGRREGQPGLFRHLRGIGYRVADKVPDELFTLLAEVAKRVEGRPPTLLLLTEEPYVPWELAWVDPPIAPGAAGFLGTQAVVGRWALKRRRPPQRPPDTAPATAMAAIWGVYDEQGSWARLKEAEAEGAELTRRYGADRVDAKTELVFRCINGDPAADVLHFALHGNYDPNGAENGLALTDGRMLDPIEVEGATAPLSPFVFLNACQVGAGQEVLGDYAGLAQAFLSAGACAVVAPLWSVNDAQARELALAFWEAVLAGASPAAVLRDRRAALGAEPALDSGVPFAYQFFGHPAMTLKPTLTEQPRA